jgi:hypothetical protein
MEVGGKVNSFLGESVNTKLMSAMNDIFFLFSKANAYLE